MVVKTIIGTPEFDHSPEREPRRIEIERKYVALFPEQFERNRAEAVPIEQIYLSHPDEPYSLRLREMTGEDGEVRHSATLKDRGEHTPNGLKRLEINAPISAEAYRYYQADPRYPRIHKLRATPLPHVSIDWLEDAEAPLIEVEHRDSGTRPPETVPFDRLIPSALFDVTGDLLGDNERRAHMLFRKTHHGEATLEQPPELSLDDIVRTITEQRRRTRQTVVTIGGRSGSGKTTLLRDIAERLAMDLPDTRLLTLSTDDYHRGKTWLEAEYSKPWTNWDAAEVYDVRSLALDLWEMSQGKPIEARRFDFASQEPVITGLHQPADIILIEGIFADHTTLDRLRNVHFHMPTPLATCIGRRLARDHAEGRLNTSIGTPEEILKYQLETAEPTFRGH